MQEDTLAVLVWINPDHTQHPQSRLLATVTDPRNPDPMAFPLDMLRKSLPTCHVAAPDTLATLLLESTPRNPLIIPLPIAKFQLGWDSFHISSIFHGEES